MLNPAIVEEITRAAGELDLPQQQRVLAYIHAIKARPSGKPPESLLRRSLPRGRLTMKTLLPESMQTGWMTVLTAPLFVGFLLVIMMLLRPQGLIPERRRRLELTAVIAAEDAQLVETQGPAGGPT
jgi:hypothetical protein